MAAICGTMACGACAVRYALHGGSTPYQQVLGGRRGLLDTGRRGWRTFKSHSGRIVDFGFGAHPLETVKDGPGTEGALPRTLGSSQVPLLCVLPMVATSANARAANSVRMVAQVL